MRTTNLAVIALLLGQSAELKINANLDLKHANNLGGMTLA